MSTRANIILRDAEGNRLCVYHHYDGYLKGVGRKLERILHSIPSVTVPEVSPSGFQPPVPEASPSGFQAPVPEASPSGFQAPVPEASPSGFQAPVPEASPSGFQAPIPEASPSGFQAPVPEASPSGIPNTLHALADYLRSQDDHFEPGFEVADPDYLYEINVSTRQVHWFHVNCCTGDILDQGFLCVY